VLQFEVDAKGADVPKDVEEVVNYVRAMNFGIQRLEELPLSLRLIREIHSELLKETRGALIVHPESFAELKTGSARLTRRLRLQRSSPRPFQK
jgi:hypothetical protein